MPSPTSLLKHQIDGIWYRSTFPEWTTVQSRFCMTSVSLEWGSISAIQIASLFSALLGVTCLELAMFLTLLFVDQTRRVSCLSSYCHLQVNAVVPTFSFVTDHPMPGCTPQRAQKMVHWRIQKLRLPKAISLQLHGDASGFFKRNCRALLLFPKKNSISPFFKCPPRLCFQSTSFMKHRWSLKSHEYHLNLTLRCTTRDFLLLYYFSFWAALVLSFARWLHLYILVQTCIEKKYLIIFPGQMLWNLH